MHKLPISPSAFTVSPRPEPRFRKASCCPLVSALETRPSETALQFPLILEGELEQAMAALQAELGAHVGAVILDRARAETKFVGNLFAGFVRGDELEDAALGRGQVL